MTDDGRAGLGGDGLEDLEDTRQDGATVEGAPTWITR